jgi:hypothetical protein
MISLPAGGRKMRGPVLFGLAGVLAAVLCLAPGAWGAKLLCVSQQELKGELTVGSCLAKGEEFAIVDDYGVVHILTPREVALTRMFSPQFLEQRAYSLKYQEMAPEINPLKRRAVLAPR